MGRAVWASAFLLHAHLTMAACVNSNDLSTRSDATCDNVASEMTSEVQPSLLQVAQQQGRQPEEQASLTQKNRKKVIRLSLPDVFLYDHLPKAGGSFIRSFFEGDSGINVGKVLPKDHVRIVTESETLTVADRAETFTVGSVRNPCEYYVSNWAFFGKKEVNLQGKDTEYFGVSEDLNTHEDQLRFAKWLRWMMPAAKPPGLLTSRILWSYFNESVANARRPPDRSPTEHGGMTEAERAIYVAAADALDPSTVDCWIHTESVPADLRTCLQKFEEQAGSKIVNWVEFDKIVAKQEKEHEEVKMEVWTKNSGHNNCNFYFDAADPTLKDHVYKTDYAIFDKFHYQSCCSTAQI
jgi:hypothetical protein